jgi:hypothetical protein
MTNIDVAAASRDGVLTIDGVVMMCPAWAVTDVTPLWMGPTQRGSDLLIPGRPGQLPNPRRADATKVTLRMVLDGSVDRDDVPWTCGEREGLRRNVLFLRQHVSDPTNIGDGTRGLALVTPDLSSTLTGRATIEALRTGVRSGPVWVATLELSLPDGALS